MQRSTDSGKPKDAELTFAFLHACFSKRSLILTSFFSQVIGTRESARQFEADNFPNLEFKHLVRFEENTRKSMLGTLFYLTEN